MPIPPHFFYQNLDFKCSMGMKMSLKHDLTKRFKEGDVQMVQSFGFPRIDISLNRGKCEIEM